MPTEATYPQIIIMSGIILAYCYFFLRDSRMRKRNNTDLFFPVLYYGILRHFLNQSWLPTVIPEQWVTYFWVGCAIAWLILYIRKDTDAEDMLNSPHFHSAAISGSYTGKIYEINNIEKHALITLEGISTPEGRFQKGTGPSVVFPLPQSVVLASGSIQCFTSLRLYQTIEEIKKKDPDVADWLRRNEGIFNLPIWYGQVSGKTLSKIVEVPALVEEPIYDEDEKTVIGTHVFFSETEMEKISVKHLLDILGVLRNAEKESNEMAGGDYSSFIERTFKLGVAKEKLSPNKALWDLRRRASKVFKNKEQLEEEMDFKED